jgi:hypothetical protein
MPSMLTRRSRHASDVRPACEAVPMETSNDAEIMEPTLWKKAGWIARIIRSDDDGWAVEMTRIGDSEPSLVGPWTMGRDKKNPKPLDAGGFATLVKGASDVVRRHEATARERLHRSITYVNDQGERVRADLDIVPDDDDPHAILALFDELSGEPIRRGRVSPAFKLNAASAQRFVRTGES